MFAAKAGLGDEEMERLVDRYGDAMLRVCCAYLGDAHLAQDAVQDAFLKIYKSYRPLEDSPASEKAFVMRVTANVCKDYLRSAWHKKVNLVEQYPELASPEAMRSESGRLLAEVLALKPKYREVVLLHYYHQYSVGEIAQLLHAPQSTVSVRLRRAREQLAKRLEEVPRDDL